MQSSWKLVALPLYVRVLDKLWGIVKGAWNSVVNNPEVQVLFRPKFTGCNRDINRIFSRRYLLQNLYLWHILQYKQNGNCCPLGTEQRNEFKSFQHTLLPTGDTDDSCFLRYGTLVLVRRSRSFHGLPPFRWSGTTDATTQRCIQEDLNLNVANSSRRRLLQVASHTGASSGAQNM